MNAASGRAVMSWFGQEERGFALGIRQTALPIGGLLAALLLPPIEAAGGLRAGLVALAAGCLVAALAGASGLREAPHDEGELTDIGHPVRDPRMWQLSIGSALVLAAQISILSFLILFLHGERGLSTAEAAGVFALIQALGAAARIVTGRWSDRAESAHRASPPAGARAEREPGDRSRAPLGAAPDPHPRLRGRWRALAELERPLVHGGRRARGEEEGGRRARLPADALSRSRARSPRRRSPPLSRQGRGRSPTGSRLRCRSPASPSCASFRSSRARLRRPRRARRCRLP